MKCKFCRGDMLLEGDDSCCDYCGATFNVITDKWTLPVLPIYCDSCESIIEDIDVFADDNLCDKCRLSS